MFPKQLIYFLRKKGQGPWILTAEDIHLIRLLKKSEKNLFYLPGIWVSIIELPNKWKATDEVTQQTR